MPDASSRWKLKKHNRYSYSPITERKDFTWPDGKRLAFYCALNVEHFSFGEGLGHTPTAAGPQPDVRNFGWRDYGLRVGIWRIFDMMDALKLPMCHLLNASVCEEMPQIPARIRQRGDEVIGHGYTNSERQSDMDAATEADMIAHATKTLADSCGLRPFGWMGPWISETAVTPDLLQENGYTFLMDWPADDQPFWMKTRKGRLLSVPYPIEINDTPIMLSRAQLRHGLSPHDHRSVRGTAASFPEPVAGVRDLDAYVLHWPTVPSCSSPSSAAGANGASGLRAGLGDEAGTNRRTMPRPAGTVMSSVHRFFRQVIFSAGVL